MKSYFGTCKQCGRDKWINNSREICMDCVYFNNHGETRIEARIRKQKEKQHKYIKKKKKPVRTKKTGEKDLFWSIWQEREHFCENCGAFLGHEAKTYYFSHIKPKSTHPELRLKKSNVELLCWDCHTSWDGNKVEYYKRKFA